MVYYPQFHKLVHDPTLPLAAVHSNTEEAFERMKSPPPYLALNCNYVGKGAERVAFRCRLSDAESTNSFVFQDMVAKETKHCHRIEDRIDFHKGFAETQDLANYLAYQFNKRLRGIPNYSPTSTPQLRFLSCSVLLLEDPSWRLDGRGVRGVLVEKMLNTDRFCWTKWNDNNGGVNGQKRAHNPVDVDFELKQIQRETNQKLRALAEGDEDSDDEDSVSDVESNSDDKAGEVDPRNNNNGIDPSDYLREFRNCDIASGFGCIII